MVAATLAAPGPAEAPERLLTIADVAALPSELPSGPVLYELDNGRLVIMPPPGDIHGAVESNIVSHLKAQGEWKGHGKVRSGDVGIILWRDPDKLVGADVIFVSKDQLPMVLSEEGYLETKPDLVVEVRSKTESLSKCETKAKNYLKAGVKVVWYADPGPKTVTEYRQGLPPKIYIEQDTLTIEDIIPGFRLRVTEVFQL